MSEIQMTFDEFKEMVKGKSDQEILASVKEQEELFLEGMFEAMKDAFDPSAAPGQTAVFQYDVDSPIGIKTFQIKVDKGVCTVMKGRTEPARVTFAINLPNLARMMALELDGMQAYTTGKLKIMGDIMFSQNVTKWFKQQQ